jgi:hypothetical protein
MTRGASHEPYHQSLVVLQENRAVLEQGGTPPELGTADHLPAGHQYLTTDWLGKTRAGIEGPRPSARRQGGLDAQVSECSRQEMVDLQIRSTE